MSELWLWARWQVRRLLIWIDWGAVFYAVVLLGAPALVIAALVAGPPEPDWDRYCARIEREITSFQACMAEPQCLYDAEQRSLHELRLSRYEERCNQREN